MSFTNTKSHKQYTIALTTNNGNTVGYINLNSHFLKAVLDTSADKVTASNILEINANDFAGYIRSLNIKVTDVKPREIKAKSSLSSY